MELEDRELTRKDERFLALLEQYWYQHAKLPSQEELAKDGISPKYYRKCMKNRTFRKQLSMLGVVDDPDDIKLVAWQLSELQLAAANVMVDMLDGRSAKTKLSDLDIDTSTWQGWLRNPEFQSYLRARSETMLKENMHEAHAGLLARVRAGDVSAIKFYYELTGRYVPDRETGLNPMETVLRVIEVVQKFVKDEEALKAIGASLLGEQQVAAQQVVRGELEQVYEHGH